MCFGDRGRCPNDALNVVSGGICFPWFRLVQHHFSIKESLPRLAVCRPGEFGFFRDSQLEPSGDADQSAGVLLYIVELSDLRGGVPQQVGHLPGGEGFEAAVRLLHPVDQVGGEGVAQGMEAPPLQASRCQDTVVPFPEVYRTGVATVLVGDEGLVLAEVPLGLQGQDGVHSGLVQGDVPLAGGRQGGLHHQCRLHLRDALTDPGYLRL